MAISGSFRGGLEVNNTVYGGWTDEIYTVDSSGARVKIGNLAGTDLLFFARNNAATPNVAIVASAGAFAISGGAIIAYPDVNVGSPTCVWGHLGYLMFGYGNGDIQASNLNSTTLNTLNKARTESNPDGVTNGISYNGQMFVFGEKTIEVWGDPTNSSGFPLTRVGYNILPGLHSPHAIAGWEPEFGNPPIYVGSDNTVRQIQGYTPVKISPPDLDRLIANDVSTTQVANMNALCYVAAGHAFWQLNGSTWSWVYDLNSQTWHERKSYGSTKSNFICDVPAFGKWLVGDTSSTDLLNIDHTLATEAGNPIIAQMESLPVIDFPNRQRVKRADLLFTQGVGIANGSDPIETDPTVLIEWSDDGGQSWSIPWWRKLGKQDETQKRVIVNNTGISGPMGRKWRWTVSDPVHLGFLGGSMDPIGLNK